MAASCPDDLITKFSGQMGIYSIFIENLYDGEVNKNPPLIIVSPNSDICYPDPPSRQPGGAFFIGFYGGVGC